MQSCEAIVIKKTHAAVRARRLPRQAREGAVLSALGKPDDGEVTEETHAAGIAGGKSDGLELSFVQVNRADFTRSGVQHPESIPVQPWRMRH